MASPIFFSAPNPSFSCIAMFKGIQFAVLGIYRLSQDQLIYENSKYFKFTIITILLSILIQVTLSIPNQIIRTCCFSLNALFQKEFKCDYLIDRLNFIQSDLLHLPQIALLPLYCYYIDTFEEIFCNGLQYIDKVAATATGLGKRRKNRSNYSTWLLKLNKIDLTNRSSISIKISQYIHLTSSQINYLSPLLKSYLKLVLINFILYSIYLLLSPSLSKPIISIFVSRFFNSKLGTRNSINIFILGLFIPSYYYIQLYSNFIFIQITIRSLLIVPYFERLKLTESQIDNWIDSRIGLIFGYGAIFHILISKFQYIAFFLLLLEQMGLAFFIYEVSDPCPEVITETWLLTQIYWTKIYKKLTCDGDGFKPLPVSYIFTSKDQSPNTSANTSAFNTPVSSTVNLQEYR